MHTPIEPNTLSDAAHRSLVNFADLNARAATTEWLFREWRRNLDFARQGDRTAIALRDIYNAELTMRGI